MNNKSNFIESAIQLFFCLSIIAIGFSSCEKNFEFELPDSNSQVDTVLPTANFSYASTLEDFRTIKFTNLSFESTTFAWDFGGGNTSDEQDPTFTFEDGEGIYPVTLTASDARGEANTVVIDVMVVEGPFQPIILEPGFEDNSLPDGSGDGRDSWRNNDVGGVIQITGSPVTFGSQGAKLPSAQDRIGYQEITVEPETNYDLRFWYTMLDNASDPWVTVAIVGVTEHGVPDSKQAAIDATLASVTVNDVTDPTEYLETQLSFNSGINNTVAIFFYNGPVEARLDNFSIEVGDDGAVPPSAGFDVAQSETDYLEYTFTNTSTNGSTYTWDFGDGFTSTEESPTHTYATADTYTVSLEVVSAEGLASTLSKTVEILAPVTADFTYQADPDNYQKYQFMDASEGAVMLLWEFGDEYQFTGMDPTHTFAEDGIYTVTLTAYAITGNTHTADAMIVVAQGFIVQVLNGTFDEYTNNTGDNADAWDMTPNSTVVDNDGNTIDSPYDPLWDNADLNAYIDATYCTNEQPGSTSDGNNNTRGAKLSNSCRRLYQVVQVEQGVEYTFSIDSRSEAMDVNTEVFILNEEIADEVGIDANLGADPAVDAYFDITNDFNTDGDVFVTSTFTFTPSTSEIVIYVRSLDAVDSSNEVFLDNVTIE